MHALGLGGCGKMSFKPLLGLMAIDAVSLRAYQDKC